MALRHQFVADPKSRFLNVRPDCRQIVRFYCLRRCVRRRTLARSRTGLQFLAVCLPTHVAVEAHAPQHGRKN
jgi:hypothetical protein